ncbi:hypothetical protein GGER_27820 [Serratia rubidaea]
MLPAAVAQYAVLQPLLQRIQNTGRGGEIHIRDGERQQVGAAEAVGDVVPLGAPGAVAVDRGGKIKHGWLQTVPWQAGLLLLMSLIHL